MSSPSRVAFLGMGLMGVPMACNLLKAGHAVACYNRTIAKTAPVVAAGGVAHATPAEAAHGAKVVISCVTDGPDVESVLLGDRGAATSASPGTLFVDMSTISPAVSISIGERLPPRPSLPRSARDRRNRRRDQRHAEHSRRRPGGGLRRRPAGAGGDGQEHHPLRRLGAGQGVKLCNQIMGAMNLLGVCEAFALARGLNIRPEILIPALGGGAANSWALQNLAPKILADNWAPGFMVDTQQKDMRLIAEAAERAGVALPGAALMTQLWRRPRPTATAPKASTRWTKCSAAFREVSPCPRWQQLCPTVRP